MDYEKKYKEALERARGFCNNEEGRVGMKPIDLEVIFPELRENEEEKIRKGIISTLKFANHKGVSDKYIEWLEKQKVLTTEEDLQGKEDVLWCIKQAKKYAKDENEMGTCWLAEQWLEKQGKQKPANKVEPKFHEGDWVVSKTSNLVYRVDSILFSQSKCYYLSHNGSIVLVNFTDEQNYRLWTIKDAKEGDVLVSKFNKPFIYDGKHTSRNVGAHCGITTSDKLIISSEECHWTDNFNIHPADKDQRDILMKAMNDEGYVFDFNKKELIHEYVYSN